MSVPDVSVVLCTYNRAGMLRECIQSLQSQRTSGEFTYEIIVVDNSSTDETPAVVAELAKNSSVPMKYVMERKPGQVHARHSGFREASGHWIANFDDDEVAEPSWLLELLRLAKEKNVRCVGGLLWLRLPDGCQRNLHPRVRRMLGESVTWPEPRPYTRTQGPGSGNQLIHRSILDEVGIYDLSHQVRGYDTDHYRRIRKAGIESWFTPRAVAYHITPESRLTSQYLRDTCFHDGWCFCRRDLAHYGAFLCAAIALCRILYTLTIYLPASWISELFGQTEAAIAYTVLLKRTEGYVRCYLYSVAPKLFAQPAMFERYRLPRHATDQTFLAPQEITSADFSNGEKSIEASRSNEAAK